MINDKRDQPSKLTCSEFQANLEASLESEHQPGFHTHAAECSRCGALFADLELIRSAARSLPLESPSPRVWSNIHATLAAEGIFREKHGFWESWIAQLRFSTRVVPIGAVGLLALLAVFLSPNYLHRKAAPDASPSVVASAVAPIKLTAVEVNLEQTVRQMEDSYKAQEAELDPVSKATYERGLSSLDSSIHECLVSLHDEPQNALARQYLMQAYSEKADILASALEYDGR